MGEFEKRMGQLSNLLSLSQNPYTLETFERMLEGIQTLVEEAKKEFPIIGWIAGISHDLSKEESLEVLMWFEKWFK